MRLIDIDRLCNDLAKWWSIADKKKEDTIRAVMADVVTPIVVSQPTVDAVPVVRCKDCLYWQKSCLFSGHMVCRYVVDCSVVRREDDFCSRGERKKGEQHGTK